jgi:regulator of sigma E protease
MLTQFGNILLAALGISFLIFIHELGHFAAARLFKVRVDTFSLGFGPRLWGIRRGATDYRLSAVPLGGYVKMAGEYGDYKPDEQPAPDELMAKPAWQRAIIFSGGVIVNFAFAFVVFPLVFSLGVPFDAPIVGSVAPGSAAWHAGLLPGDEILAVNGNRIYQFPDVALEVALSDPEHCALRVRRDGRELDLQARPQRNEAQGRLELGIGPALTLHPEEDKALWRAGLRNGDRLLSVNGVDVTRSGWAVPLERAIVLGRELDIEFERPGQSEPPMRMKAHVAPDLAGTFGDPMLGVTAPTTRLTGVRGALRAGGLPLQVDDVLLEVGGLPVFTEEDIAAALRSAPPGDVPLKAQRGDETLALTLPASLREPLLAGEAAFDSDLDRTRVQVIPDGALAAAGVNDGDELQALNDEPVSTYRELQAKVAGPTTHFAVRYRRASDGRVVTVTADARQPTLRDYGFGLEVVQVLRKESPLGAVRAGFDTSLNMMRTTWITLTKLFTGEVASKNLGGIVSISQLTYHFAGGALTQLLFFLGLLSINLGFINVLPVPVLDGGQVLLLVCEKIYRRRLPERFMNLVQLAGLIVIVALVLYVTYNDIARLVG